MTQHRHKDSHAKWTTLVTDPDLTPYATDADVAALAARITKLEADLADTKEYVYTIGTGLAEHIAEAPVPPVPPDPPGTPWTWSTLQEGIDATVSGGTLDATGFIFTESVTITKPITLIGATIQFSGGIVRGVTVRSSNVTLDTVTVTGPQFTTYVGGQDGIEVLGKLGTPLTGVTITSCVVEKVGAIGIRAYFVDDLLIEDSTISDCVYAGIMALSCREGSIEDNTVERIGVYGAAANGNNAYGIALSQQSPGTDYVSADFTVSGNIVNDVPTWHGLDTHSGARIVWSGNVVRRCRSGFFITGGNGRAVDNDINGNTVYAPTSADHYAITSVYSTDGYVRNNTIDGWPSGHEILTTSSGDPDATAVNLTISGNTIVP
jgi:hypothetical protein